MKRIRNWWSRSGWSTATLLLVIALLAVSGVRVANNWDRNQSAKGTLVLSLGEKNVITLGDEAQAAGSVDYTFGAANADVQFLAALNALPATGGRLVVVSAVQINWTPATSVTRAIPNVTIEGSGAGSSFVGDGVTSEFIAGGNNWVFLNTTFDVAPSMGATTNWMWTNVTAGGTYYAYRSPYGSSAVGSLTANTANVTSLGVSGTAVLTTANITTATITTANVTTLNAPTGRGATFIVASTNAPANVRAQADYVASAGTTQGSIIQTAINALDPILGGEIKLFGQFNNSTGNSINITTSGVTLSGEGPGGRDPTPYGGTVIIAGAQPNLVIDGGNVSGNISNVVIRDLGLTDGTIGIDWVGGVVDSFVINVKIEDPSSASIRMEANGGAVPQWIYIQNTNMTGGSVGALDISGSSTTQIINSGFYSSTGPGINITGNALVQVTNSRIEYVNGAHAIYMSPGQLHLSNSYVAISPSSANNTYDLLYIGNGSALLSNNTLESAGKARYAINAPIVGTVFQSNNYFSGAFSTGELGGSRFSLMSGTATIPALSDNVTVNHNLYATPAGIQLTMASDPGISTYLFTSNTTATQFRVNSAAAVTNNTTIHWRATVGVGD